MKKENQPLDVWYGCVRFECRSNKICVNDKFSWGVKITNSSSEDFVFVHANFRKQIYCAKCFISHFKKNTFL